MQSLLLLFPLALLLLGMWIPFVVAGAGISLLYAIQGAPGLRSIGLVTWNSINSFTLTAIPLYVLMAEFLLRSGLADRLYKGLSFLIRGLPGGLLQTNIAGCAVFSAISGSSVTTAASIATVALPELKKRGYPMQLAYGSLAAGGTLGIMIPPSIAMIIYGTFTEVSIVKLFIAGIVPGLALALMFMLFLGVAARTFRGGRIATLGQDGADSHPDYGLVQSLVDVVPTLGLIVLIIVALYMGWAAPTEAAALGCSLALVFSFLLGKFDAGALTECFRQTVTLSTSILLIVTMAFLFSYAVTVAGIPRQLTAAVASLDLNRLQFLLILFGVYLLLGMVVESIAMIVITVPLVFPMLPAFHIDPVWFCIFLVGMVELGQITPPFGINLFVIQSIGKSDFRQVAMGSLPFVTIFVLFTAMIVFFPGIVTWLPSLIQK